MSSYYTTYRFFIIMGRPRKNKFEESSIAFKKGTEFERNLVKVPFFVNVTIQDEIGKYNDGKPIYGTTTIMLKRDISEKDEIIKQLQKDGKREVLKVEEYPIQFSSLCPDCNRHGIPKVERKSNKTDYHYRVETRSAKTEVSRPDEYWLCYDHETKPKKCRIAQWDKNHFLFKKNGRAYTELTKYLMPYYVEWQQNGKVVGLTA